MWWNFFFSGSIRRSYLKRWQTLQTVIANTKEMKRRYFSLIWMIFGRFGNWFLRFPATHTHTSSTGPERFAQRRYKKTTRTFSRLIATPHNFHIGNSLARKHINTLVMIPLKYPRLNYADGDSVPVTISCTQPVLFFFCSSRIIRFFPGPADKASFRNAQEYNESRSSVWGVFPKGVVITEPPRGIYERNKCRSERRCRKCCTINVIANTLL